MSDLLKLPEEVILSQFLKRVTFRRNSDSLAKGHDSALLL